MTYYKFDNDWTFGGTMVLPIILSLSATQISVGAGPRLIDRGEPCRGHGTRHNFGCLYAAMGAGYKIMAAGNASFPADQASTAAYAGRSCRNTIHSSWCKNRKSIACFIVAYPSRTQARAWRNKLVHRHHVCNGVGRPASPTVAATSFSQSRPRTTKCVTKTRAIHHHVLDSPCV